MVSKTEKKPAVEGARKSTRAAKEPERYAASTNEMTKRAKVPKSKGIVKNPKKSAAKGSKSPKKATKDTKGKKEKSSVKRGTSAYIFFSNDHRAKVKKDNPNATFAELGSLLGEAWKSCKPADKKKYEDMAAKDKTRYEKEKAAEEKKSKKE